MHYTWGIMMSKKLQPISLMRFNKQYCSKIREYNWIKDHPPYDYERDFWRAIKDSGLYKCQPVEVKHFGKTHVLGLKYYLDKIEKGMRRHIKERKKLLREREIKKHGNYYTYALPPFIKLWDDLDFLQELKRSMTINWYKTFSHIFVPEIDERMVWLKLTKDYK